MPKRSMQRDEFFEWKKVADKAVRDTDAALVALLEPVLGERPRDPTASSGAANQVLHVRSYLRSVDVEPYGVKSRIGTTWTVYETDAGAPVLIVTVRSGWKKTDFTMRRRTKQDGTLDLQELANFIVGVVEKDTKDAAVQRVLDERKELAQQALKNAGFDLARELPGTMLSACTEKTAILFSFRVPFAELDESLPTITRFAHEHLPSRGA